MTQDLNFALALVFVQKASFHKEHLQNYRAPGRECSTRLSHQHHQTAPFPWPPQSLPLRSVPDGLGLSGSQREEHHPRLLGRICGLTPFLSSSTHPILTYFCCLFTNLFKLSHLTNSSTALLLILLLT